MLAPSFVDAKKMIGGGMMKEPEYQAHTAVMAQGPATQLNGVAEIFKEYDRVATA